MKKQFSKVTIIGPGLIGSSLGLALKKKKIARHILGIDKSLSNLDNAVKNGSIDEGSRKININITHKIVQKDESSKYHKERKFNKGKKRKKSKRSKRNF